MAGGGTLRAVVVVVVVVLVVVVRLFITTSSLAPAAALPLTPAFPPLRVEEPALGLLTTTSPNALRFRLRSSASVVFVAGRIAALTPAAGRAVGTFEDVAWTAEGGFVRSGALFEGPFSSLCTAIRPCGAARLNCFLSSVYPLINSCLKEMRLTGMLLDMKKSRRME